jgi:copper resistance protein B
MRNKLMFQKSLTFAALIYVFASSALAQQDSNDLDQPTSIKMSQDNPMDHTAMHNTASSDTKGIEAKDHSKMQQNMTGDKEMPMDKPAINQPQTMSEMSQTNMPSKSSTAPTDARDPNAYSNGLTLDTGVYALPGPRTLILADEHSFGTILFNRLEYADGRSKNSDNIAEYDMQAWYGGTYDQLVIKSEGQVANNKLLESETQILWGHAISTFWDLQTGLKFDTSEGPSRQWLTIGLQGLAPYWFEVNSNISVDNEGHSALSLEAEYELLITQRIVVQPRVLVTAYGKDDTQTGAGKGLSSLTAGIRMRYEFNRKFAPYVGVEWTGQYGNTADFRKLEGSSTSDTQLVAGIRFWFQ